MTDATHDQLVERQFGGQAAAYVASAVHAGGDDLRQLEALARGRAGGRVLDLGCGGGHVGFTVAPHVAEVVACDLSERMLAAVAAEAARRGIGNLVPRQGAAERLPFPDQAFDLVLSRYSAHHWHDLGRGVAEAARVLKPGGIAVFVDVASPGPAPLDTFLQAIELLRDPSHVRNRSEAEWRAVLEAAGLRPGAVVPRRLRLDFASWVARMRTKESHVAAIRSLQAGASAEVRAHYAIEPDGTFTVDTLAIEAAAPG